MKTASRICIEDCTITDEEGTSFTLERGKEYDTSVDDDDGKCIVFSRYWVTVPVSIFAGKIVKDNTLNIGKRK
jgi:hypothetical protein